MPAPIPVLKAIEKRVIPLRRKMDREDIEPQELLELDILYLTGKLLFELARAETPSDFAEVASEQASLFFLALESWPLEPEAREKVRRCIQPGARKRVVEWALTDGRYSPEQVLESLRHDPLTLAVARKKLAS